VVDKEEKGGGRVHWGQKEMLRILARDGNQVQSRVRIKELSQSKTIKAGRAKDGKIWRHPVGVHMSSSDHLGEVQ
jgi:hypothetical protein